MPGKRTRFIIALLAGTASATLPNLAWAQNTPTYEFDLPSQDLGDALREVAARAGWELYAPADAVNGVPAPRLRARLTARQAIEQLIAGTDLQARFTKGAVIIRGRSEAAVAASEATSSEIIVTGSRIRGASPAAPVITLTAEDMHRAGQTDLGDVFRSLTENFAGGQNPGIGTNQGSTNVNVNGSSSVNLFGLGPNATLTLLNGNRLSYTGVNAAVDVSAIPAIAVDRIEIIADGASAIYGADAVAGVVNVKLRRDYDGLSVMGRLAGTTDGGGFQQQYGAVAGHIWSNGGVLAVYDHLANEPIYARQRDYTAKMGSDATIYPRLRRHNALLSVVQNFGDRVSANIDLVFKDTQQYAIQGYVTGQPHTVSGADGEASSQTFSIAPNLSVKLGDDWSARLIGSYSFDNTRINSSTYSGGVAVVPGLRRYDNSSVSLELGTEGSLFDLPAGAVRAAFGGGYRRTGIEVIGRNGSITSVAINRHRENEFGYAELFIPLVSPEQDSPLGHSLSLTGAYRYEWNSGVDSVGVPKLGIIYSPITGITLKGSWGRSFRLPTVYQQYSGYSVLLLPVTGYGTGFAADATFIGLAGAGPDMRPEKSENWTISAELRPAAAPGLSGSVSYFHFDYTDRVATPVATALGALNNPLYAALITLNPTAAQQTASFADAPFGLQNAAGVPYDPSKVVAILDIRDRNVAKQTFRGVDASLRYQWEIAKSERLDFSLAGTWIHSEQQLLPGLPTVDLAGAIFNPPRFKARAAVSFIGETVSASGYFNVSSRLTDNRRSTTYRIDGLSTFDLSAQLKAAYGLEFGVTINNIFNQKPDVIVTGSPNETTFDTTNFSPMGRTIAVLLRKSW